MNQVRKFTSEAELVAHYKAVHRRLRPPVVLAPQPLTPPALPVLLEAPPSKPVQPAPETAVPSLVLNILESRYAVPREDIVGCGRTANLVRIRHIAFYVIRLLRPGFSLPMIGRLFGHRDHTTILHGYRRMAQKYATNPETKAEIDSILAEVRNKTAAWSNRFNTEERQHDQSRDYY